MPTVKDTLKSISPYPIPMKKVEEVAVMRNLDLDTEVDASLQVSDAFNLSLADLLVWLSGAPNVSQGGQSYAFSDNQREDFKKRASKIYRAFGEEEKATALEGYYGYLGDRL